MASDASPQPRLSPNPHPDQASGSLGGWAWRSWQQQRLGNGGSIGPSARGKVAAIAASPVSAVVLTVAAGSLIITSSIAVPCSADAATMISTLSARLGSASDASAALGIALQSEPTMPQPVPEPEPESEPEPEP